VAKRLELDVRLNGPQMRAHRALFADDGSVRRGITIFTAFGRGVGKTWYARQVWWLLVAAFDHKLRTEALAPFRGVRITCICPTLKQWKDINWGGIVEELGRGGKWEWLGAKLDAQTGQIRFPGGSSIRPFPATAYSARTARGMRTDVLDADEFDDVDAEIYDGTAVPWLSEPWSLGIELLRGTPTRGRHGLWWRTLRAGRLGEQLRSGVDPKDALSPEEIERYRDLAGGDDAGVGEVVSALKRIHAFHATYEDAPETVSARAIARAIATTPPATFRREWRADPDAGEGLIYPFEESFHVREPPPLERFREFHIGVDFGWVDAAVLLLAGVQGHGEDSTLWFLDESYESGVPNHIWDQRAQAMHNACVPYGRPTFWPDPSRPERAHDFRTMGLTVGQVDNDILAGVGRVAELMFIRRVEGSDERWARLYISPKCRNLIAELGKYRRKKLPDGSFDEMPEDKWNHACDAGRYLVVGRFGRSQNYRSVVSGR
jgi:hypothetical protein